MDLPKILILFASSLKGMATVQGNETTYMEYFIKIYKTNTNMLYNIVNTLKSELLKSNVRLKC